MDILSFKRNCPKCNKEILYSKKDSLKRAEKQNRLCISCSLIGNTHTKGISPPNKGKFSDKIKQSIDGGFIWNENGIWYRKCPSCKSSVKCSTYDNAYRRIKDVCHRCGILKNIGSKRSIETRNKQRISAIKRIQKYQLYNKPSFNPKACEFIDKVNNQLKFNLQHALNGGEVWLRGFYPDGYDKEKNIVFEYDEIKHSYPSVKIKDLQRQKIILDEIKPSQFLRYDEKDNRLYDCKTQETIPILL